MLKILKNKKGITLLELIVAVGIFSVVVLAAAGIFRAALEGQRSAIAAQNLQESMRYAMEVMSKEMRTAQKGTGGECGGLNEDVYLTENVGELAGNELYFKNYKSPAECVKYYLDSGRIKVDRGVNSDYITPDEIRISNLEFVIIDNIPSKQSIVTMKMDIETAGGKDIHKQSATVETSVSARYYE